MRSELLIMFTSTSPLAPSLRLLVIIFALTTLFISPGRTCASELDLVDSEFLPGVFLQYFEPGYYESLPESESVELGCFALDELPSQRNSSDGLSGGIMGFHATRFSVYDGDVVQIGLTVASLALGGCVHARVVAIGEESKCIYLNASFGDLGYCEVDGTFHFDVIDEDVLVIALGYVVDGDIAGYPLFSVRHLVA